jgi:hypothetical protein
MNKGVQRVLPGEEMSSWKSSGSTHFCVSHLASVFLLCIAVAGGLGCQSRLTQMPMRPGELCRVHEVVYRHGNESCAIIFVYADGRYELQRFGPPSNSLSLRPSFEALHSGKLNSEVLTALEKSVHSGGKRWVIADGVPTYYINLDDSWTINQDSVERLRRVARSEARR